MGRFDLEIGEIESEKARWEDKYETEHRERHDYDRASTSQQLTMEIIGDRQTNDYMTLK